jgi:hypothetical protein
VTVAGRTSRCVQAAGPTRGGRRLETSLAGARDKLVQMDAAALRTASAVDLGMPTFTKIAGRVSAPEYAGPLVSSPSKGSSRKVSARFPAPRTLRRTRQRRSTADPRPAETSAVPSPCGAEHRSTAATGHQRQGIEMRARTRVRHRGEAVRREHALVVVEVMSWQVVIKISAQQIGVRTVAERGKGDAVGRAGIGPLAGEQKVTDPAAELSPASYKAACTNSLVNTSRSGPINRSELPPNRR